MKAVVYTEYGSPDVLHVTDVDKPVPKANEILIKVHASSVNFGDLLARNMRDLTPSKFTMPAPLWLPTRFVFGFRKPKINILGAEFSGVVESIGNDVKQFKVGDQVFGYRGAKMGSNAEYLCVAEDSSVAVKPSNLSHEEAAGVPYGAIMAIPILKKANIQAGQNVLINGASGAIGSYAVQLAKHYGAEVTGVCSTSKVDYVKALGADHVIDYTKADFANNGKTYDVIFDVLGKSSFAHCKDSLNPNGIHLYGSFKMKQVFQMLWTSFVGNKKVICALSPEDRNDLVKIRELIEAGEIKSIVDQCYPMEQAAEAHRYIEAGHKKGHVIISIA